MKTEAETCEDLSPELLQILACPRDKQELRADGGFLHCQQGHRYRVVRGVPIRNVLNPESNWGSDSLARTTSARAITRPVRTLVVEVRGFPSDATD